MERWGLIPRLLQAGRNPFDEPWLDDGEIQRIREDLLSFLNDHDFHSSLTTAPGQPLTLDLRRDLFALTGDIDPGLIPLLRDGVPIGIKEIIPASEMTLRTLLPLLIYNSLWGSALDDPAALMDLIQKDVDSGFAEWIAGGREEVLSRFGADCAAGRLDLVKKEGAISRLVGDNTISNANRLYRIAEKIELPDLIDVIDFMSRHSYERWVAFSLDVKKAHKWVKMAPSEQGFSVSKAVDPGGVTRWLVYLACHFGGTWSAYWWSRVAAGFVRSGHVLLHSSHFLSMHVDDGLSLFPAASAPLMACIEVLLAYSLGIPLS